MRPSTEVGGCSLESSIKNIHPSIYVFFFFFQAAQQSHGFAQLQRELAEFLADGSPSEGIRGPEGVPASLRQAAGSKFVALADLLASVITHTRVMLKTSLYDQFCEVCDKVVEEGMRSHLQTIADNLVVRLLAILALGRQLPCANTAVPARVRVRLLRCSSTVAAAWSRLSICVRAATATRPLWCKVAAAHLLIAEPVHQRIAGPSHRTPGRHCSRCPKSAAA